MMLDTSKVTEFIKRHKEAVAVAAVALVVIHRQSKQIDSMENFLTMNRLDEAYNQANR